LQQPVFLKHVVRFVLACGNACTVLNKSFGFKYEMLITFHAIWYVFAELCTPARQKDLRDISFFIIEAMKEAKKNQPVGD